MTLKGGWGKHGSESLPGGFWGLRVEFWDNFFFQTASLDARIAMVGSDHPFDERMGRLGRKGVLAHNLGLGARKTLASVPIVLKWGKISRAKKRERSVTVDFDGRYLTIGGSDRRSAGADGKGRGETYWHDECGHKSYKFRHKKGEGVQHEDFPGGHPSQYYSRPSTLNRGVLMGSGALVLV